MNGANGTRAETVGLNGNSPDATEVSEEGLSSEDGRNDGADAANVWPDEHAEAAFIAETRGRGEVVAVASPDVVEELSAKPLPALDELVKRIPVDTRELLDELFRAKFTTVRRVKKSDLKS